MTFAHQATLIARKDLLIEVRGRHALGTLLPFGVELLALRHLRATTVTMVAMLEPVGVSALGWLWFNEELGAVALIGGVAVVVGIMLAQSARRAPVVVEPPHL